RGELRLACQYERQELLCGRFDVREQADLFEQIVAETLSLVHDERRDLAPRPALPEHALECLEESGLGIRRVAAELETGRECLDEVFAGKDWIVQADPPDVATLFGFERRAQQRGLSRAGFPHEHRNRFGRAQAVVPVADRLAVS